MTKPLTATEKLDLLSLAAAHLHDLGWCQYAMALAGGKRVTTSSEDADQYCLVGSLQVAVRVGMGYANRRQSQALEEMAILVGPVFPINLAAWNDARERTLPDVLELLSRAAHELSSK